MVQTRKMCIFLPRTNPKVSKSFSFYLAALPFAGHMLLLQVWIIDTTSQSTESGKERQWRTARSLLRAWSGNWAHHFFSHLFGQNLVTWPYPAARAAGKCSPWMGECRANTEGVQLWQERENEWERSLMRTSVTLAWTTSHEGVQATRSLRNGTTMIGLDQDLPTSSPLTFWTR